ncbi:MAG TPA: flagellar hook-associated protein FlgK [Flavihumibacter sp.]
MITPSFFGLFNAQRGLMASQNAINVINHNIANAATPGYSRQRVDLMAAPAYASPSLYMSFGGQIGQGTLVQQITRSRDLFLDTQYRKNSSSYFTDAVTADILQQLESILNEPTDSGINFAMQSFFDAAHELSLHPESAAVRASYAQAAIDMLTVFQQQGLQLADLRKNLVGDPNVPGSFNTCQAATTVAQVNEMLSQIAVLNKSIVSVRASGAEPNDLLDQRDKLLDELSNLVDIDVQYYDNGQVDVTIAGQKMIRGVELLDSLEAVQNTGTTPTPDDMPILIRTKNGGEILNDGTGAEIKGGTLKGIITMGGNAPETTTIKGILDKLSTLLNEIVSQVNTLQQAGRDQDGNLGVVFFVNDPSLNPPQTMDLFHWKVNPDIVQDPRLIAAAADDPDAPGGFAGEGDGSNALALANLRDQALSALGGATLGDYLNGVVSKLGIDSQSAQNRKDGGLNLLETTDMKRQSVSGVNLDEETIDLLRYQRSIEASSKVISILDEIIQTIINMAR